GDDRLGLAAGEQRGAVDARQHADLRGDRTHGVGRAAVDADLGREDRVAHRLVYLLAELLRQVTGRPGLRLRFGGDGGEDRLLEVGDRVLALELVAHLEGLGELLADRGADRADDTFVGSGRAPGPLR